MLRVGLTGGIGAGKSTVARIFAHFGIPVYTSDERAKQLIDVDIDLQESILRRFGQDLLGPTAQLNRKALAQIVFRDAKALADLNALVHPAVGRDLRAWFESLDSETPYALQEAAILFETGSYHNLDRTILVTAPRELRIERVMNRDNVTREEVLSRMDKQWTDEEKSPLADFLVVNDGHQSLILQVHRIHEELRNC